MLGNSSKTYSPKWWFDGDESQWYNPYKFTNQKQIHVEFYGMNVGKYTIIT